MRIHIASYDPGWPAAFAAEAQILHGAFHPFRSAIQHVGSTSVPGLPAKPVIDILLAVPDSCDEESYLPAVSHVGYVLKIREPHWYHHRFLQREHFNLHVFSEGCEEIRRMLAFRDWLRSHPADRDRYAEVKRELAQQDWPGVDQYATAKTKVIEEILARSLY